MAEENQVQSIWNEVWEIYTRHTNRDLRRAPELRNLSSVEDLIEQINKQNGDFKKWRKRGEGVISKLRLFAQPVMSLGSIAQSAVSMTPFAPTSPVLGAVLFLVGAAGDVTSAYDCIEGLFEQLREFGIRMVEYSRNTMPISLRSKTVATLTFMIEIFGRSECLVRQGRVVKYMKGVFLGGDSETKAAFARFQKFVDNEQSLVIAIMYSSVQDVKKTGEETKMLVEESKRDLTKLIVGNVKDTKADEQDKAERKAVEENLQTLARTKNLTTQTRLTRDILTWSCEWINDKEVYQKWKQRKVPILWIFGEVDIGKTFLCNKIISLLQSDSIQSLQRTSRIHIAYFYISPGDQDLSSLDSMLKAIALQFVEKDSAFQRHVAIKYKSQLSSVSKPEDLWDHLFLSYFKPSEDVTETTAFVIVDGIDHAPKKERRAFLGLMKTLTKFDPEDRPRIQIAVTGRPSLRDDISRSGIDANHGENGEYIDFNESSNADDIEKYIKKKINKIRVIRTQEDSRRKKLQRKELATLLSDRADGMLPWAVMILEQIEDLDRLMVVKKHICDAPRGLEKMIRKTVSLLARDTDIQKTDLVEMLLWVACARRPLMLGEMDVILRLLSPNDNGIAGLEDRLRKKFASIFTLNDSGLPATEGIQELTRRNLASYMLLLDGTENSQEKIDDIDEVRDQDKGGKESDEEDEDEFSVTDSEDSEEQPRETANSAPAHSATESPISDSDLANIEINFKYASIRSCLISEEITETSRNDEGICVNLKEADLHITITCLKVLCDEHHEDRFHAPNLSEYAADNFGLHLSGIDIHALGAVDKNEILRPLYTIFHDPVKMKVWQDNLTSNEAFLDNWFGDDTRARPAAQNLFAEGGKLPDDDKFILAERQWMQSAARSTKELFRPLATYCAKEWLTIDGFGQNVDFYVQVLHLYYKMVDDTGLRPGSEKSDESDPKHENDEREYEDQVLSESSIRGISAEEIREIARYGNLEETAYWHTRVARALFDAGHLDDAFSTWAIALEKDPQNWLAMYGIARCYYYRKQLDTAILWLQQSLSVTPKDAHMYILCFLETLSNWSSENGDTDKAIEASANMLTMSPKNPKSSSEYLVTVSSHIWTLMNGRRYKAVIDLAETLEKDSLGSTENSSLTELILFMSNMYATLGLAGQLDGRMEFAENALAKAYGVAEAGQGAIMKADHRRAYGGFLYAYTNDVAGSVKIYEKIIEASTNPSEEDWFAQHSRRSASTHLSQFYYNEAVAAKKRNAPFDEWISKLKELCKGEDGPSEATRDWRRTNELSVLGLWYRQEGKSEAAKACFRGQVLRSIEILTDDDPENDTIGYCTLAETLLMAGQKTHFDAAFAICMKPLDDAKAFRSQLLQVATTETTETPATATQAISSMSEDTNLATKLALTPLQPKGRPPPAFFYGCDGNCPHESRNEQYQELHFCEICLNTCFCELCIKVVQAGKLPYRKCSPDHSWYQAYPIPEELKTKEKDTVKVDGQILTLKEWLVMLGSEYNG